MITCDFKGGIGTSSRRVGIDGDDYTSACWCCRTSASCAPCASTARRWARCWSRCSATPRARAQRRVDHRRGRHRRAAAVAAAHAPVQARGAGHRPGGLVRGARLGRDHRRLLDRQHRPARRREDEATLEVLLDEACDPLYEAVVECTEEAIVNALCMADEMRGQSGHVAPGAAARSAVGDPAALQSGVRHLPRQVARQQQLGASPCASVSSSPTSATSSRPTPASTWRWPAHRRGHDVRFVSVDDLSFLDDNNVLATTTRVRAGDYATTPDYAHALASDEAVVEEETLGELRRRLPALQPDPRGGEPPGRAADRLRLAAAAGGHAGRQRPGGAAARRQPHVPGRLPGRRPHAHAGVALEDRA